MLFSIMTKILNWEILTENLVTFKMWDGVKDEKFYYYGGSLKNVTFRGWGKTNIQGNCLKRGGSLRGTLVF